MRAVLAIFTAGVIVVVASFFVLIAVLSDGGDRDCGSIAFPTKASWDGLEPLAQRDLARDLQACSRYDGRTSGEVVGALGRPASAGRDQSGRTQYVYDVGPAELADRLFLTLGPSGRVVDVSITQNAPPL